MSTENEKISVVGNPAVNLEESIIEDLSARENNINEDAPQAIEPSPAIDLSKLSPEMLQQLKAALAATPDRVDQGNKNKTVQLREIQGKIVVDFKNAFLGLVDDEVNLRKMERHIIPVLLEGEKEFKNVLYKDFMQSPQITAEVIRMSKEEVPIVEGETHDPYGNLVEVVRTDIRYTFDLKLPDGRDITMPGKIVNA